MATIQTPTQRRSPTPSIWANVPNGNGLGKAACVMRLKSLGTRLNPIPQHSWTNLPKQRQRKDRLAVKKLTLHQHQNWKTVKE